MMQGLSPAAGWRHDAYVQGGKSRRDLQRTVITGGLPDVQLDFIGDLLRRRFSLQRFHGKYDPYIDTVLFPEVILRLAMRFLDLSRASAVSAFDHYAQ